MAFLLFLLHKFEAFFFFRRYLFYYELRCDYTKINKEKRWCVIRTCLSECLNIWRCLGLVGQWQTWVKRVCSSRKDAWLICLWFPYIHQVGSASSRRHWVYNIWPSWICTSRNRPGCSLVSPSYRRRRGMNEPWLHSSPCCHRPGRNVCLHTTRTSPTQPNRRQGSVYWFAFCSTKI